MRIILGLLVWLGLATAVLAQGAPPVLLPVGGGTGATSPGVRTLESFGAVPYTGGTIVDSTAAIQAACAWSGGSSPHGIVFVDGTFYTQKVTVTDYCHIMGTDYNIDTIYHLSYGVTGTATTGGTLAAGNYYIRVYALDSGSNVLKVMPRFTYLSINGTTQTAATVTWPAVTGAVTYQVYFDTGINGLSPVSPTHSVTTSGTSVTITTNPTSGTPAPNWIDPVFEVSSSPLGHLDLTQVQINGNGVASHAVYEDDIASGYNFSFKYISAELGGGVLGALYQGTFRYFSFSYGSNFTGGVNTVQIAGGADQRYVGDSFSGGSNYSLYLSGATHSANFTSSQIYQGQNGVYTDASGGQNQFTMAHIDTNFGTGASINGKGDALISPTFVGNCSAGSTGCYDWYTNQGPVLGSSPSFLRSAAAANFPNYNLYFDSGAVCPSNISGVQNTVTGSTPYTTGLTNNLSCAIGPVQASQLAAGAAAANLGSWPATVFNIDTTYGAVGNGVSDDYSHFAAALAACASGGGGHAIFGAHQYYLGTTLVIPANCSLEGQAPGLGYSANNAAFFQTQPYELLLGSGVTIQCGSGSVPDASCGISNMTIVRAGMTAATNVSTSFAQINAMTGTGITIPHTSQGSRLQNLVIAGFNLGIDNESDDARIGSVYGDNTNGMLTNNATNMNFVQDIDWMPVLTAVPTNQVQQLSIIGIANDGTGQAQITISGTTAEIANGYPIYLTLSAVTGRADLAGKWTIANVATGGGNTTFSLVGSSYGGPTVTGAVTSGSNYVTGLSALSQLGYFGTQTVSDSASGNCIPAATTVSWINPDTSVAYLSAPATCTAGTDSIVVTPAAYVSGGTAVINVQYRSGYGYSVTNSQLTFFDRVFDFGHQIEFSVGTGSTWAQFHNFGCDGDSFTVDPTRICIDIESNASMAQFIGGTLVDAGINMKVNSSANRTFPNIFEGLTVYANKYLGAEVLNGGAMFGSTVNFRSTYPNFIGDGASVQSWANMTTTASPNTLYQSAGDSANIGVSVVGNMTLSGSLGVGAGETAPAYGVQTLGQTTTYGFRVDDGTAASQSYAILTPALWEMHRSSGSSQVLEIETLNQSTWGAAAGAGAIWLNPGGGSTNGFACFTDVRCNIGLGVTALPLATLEIGGTLRLSGGTPTIATNACGSTTQGTITGTDETGVLTVGTATVTSCTVTFSATLPAAPRECQFSPANSTAANVATTGAYIGTRSTTNFVISGLNLSGAAYNYSCM